MQKNISFRGVESVEIVNYVYEKIPKIEQFLLEDPGNKFINIDVNVEKARLGFLAELHLKTQKYDMKVSHDGPDKFQEIDHVIDSMYQALLKAREEE